MPAKLKVLTRQPLNRLKDRLDEFGYDGIWQAEYGYILRLGAARQVFLSADESSNVVGHTADLLLEVDESQDVSRGSAQTEKRLRLDIFVFFSGLQTKICAD
jgi:hypothetical protein